MANNGRPVDADDKPTKTLSTPQPSFKQCSTCENGPELLDGKCEPCYRTFHLAIKHRELDKLIHRMSEINTYLVTHEARLTDAKVKYNKAIKQNWTCARGCGRTFDYYGELFAHEQEKACNKPRSALLRRQASRDEGII